MRLQRLAICALFLMAGCGDSPTQPSRPPAVPTARLQMEGGSQWQFCLIGGVCTFRGELRNTGVGCATTVRGVTKFYDASEAVIGAGYQWGGADGVVIRPNELFVYAIGAVPWTTANTSKTYVTEPSWTNVTCP